MSSFDQQIDLDEFIVRIHKFRERMGCSTYTGEQRRAMKRALVLSYFDMDAPVPDIVHACEILNQNLTEYVLRMELLGEEP